MSCFPMDELLTDMSSRKKKWKWPHNAQPYISRLKQIKSQAMLNCDVTDKHYFNVGHAFLCVKLQDLHSPCLILEESEIYRTWDACCSWECLY